jgi:hypothetical protein
MRALPIALLALTGCSWLYNGERPKPGPGARIPRETLTAECGKITDCYDEAVAECHGGFRVVDRDKGSTDSTSYESAGLRVGRSSSTTTIAYVCRRGGELINPPAGYEPGPHER